MTGAFHGKQQPLFGQGEAADRPRIGPYESKCLEDSEVSISLRVDLNTTSNCGVRASASPGETMRAKTTAQTTAIKRGFDGFPAARENSTSVGTWAISRIIPTGYRLDLLRTTHPRWCTASFATVISFASPEDPAPLGKPRLGRLAIRCGGGGPILGHPATRGAGQPRGGRASARPVA